MRLRTLLTSSALILSSVMISAPASAHPHDHSHEEQQVKKPAEPFKMPTQGDIDEAMAQMPDVGAMMGDMMSILMDEDAIGGMKRSGEMMRKRMDGPMSKRDENGMPEFGEMFEVMFGMFGDEEFMQGFFGMIEPMQEVMEKHAPAEKITPQKHDEVD